MPTKACRRSCEDFYYSRGVSLDSTFEPIDGGVDRVCRGALDGPKDRLFRASRRWFSGGYRGDHEKKGMNLAVNRSQRE